LEHVWRMPDPFGGRARWLGLLSCGSVDLQDQFSRGA
ncbi:MAG: hypothetical protein ACI9XZ_003484, partial [Alphaproteobacteria bacterium]